MKKNNKIYPEISSFRDPAGFLFFSKQKIYRQINKTGQEDFDFFINSGLYKSLVKKKMIVSHQDITKKFKTSSQGYKIIAPQFIPFISYPYEWCFGQLKDAALLTLEIQELALKYNMSLKDSSAYNVQFIGCNPIFIDTLSFEKYQEEKPWIAYRQFCQHFLAPLTLMTKKDPILNILLKNFIDGIPLDLTSRLMSFTSKFSPSLFFHIYFQSLLQKKQLNKKINTKYKMNKSQMISLIKNLKNTIKKMKIKKTSTEWQNYYSFSSYTQNAFSHKKTLIEKFLKKIKPKSLLDLGTNEGVFSKISSSLKIYTIACDKDPLVIEKLYQEEKKDQNKFLLPLIVDLSNPSPALGWANKERKSFIQRMRVDCVMALALIHHLTTSNNLPFKLIAEFLSHLGDFLIIEFVPKDDSNAKILFQNRENIFSQYNQKNFEKVFEKKFDIIESQKIIDSKRILYLMRKK